MGEIGGDATERSLTSLENRTCCLNSPLRAMTLTSAYSSKPAKTNIRQADIQTSIALIYETRGNCERIPREERTSDREMAEGCQAISEVHRQKDSFQGGGGEKKDAFHRPAGSMK